MFTSSGKAKAAVAVGLVDEDEGGRRPGGGQPKCEHPCVDNRDGVRPWSAGVERLALLDGVPCDVARSVFLSDTAKGRRGARRRDAVGS